MTFRELLEADLNKQSKDKLQDLFMDLVKEYKKADSVHHQIDLRLKNKMLRWSNNEIEYIWSLYKSYKF